VARYHGDTVAALVAGADSESDKTATVAGDVVFAALLECGGPLGAFGELSYHISIVLKGY
jgi:hypothetical protein